MGEIMTKTIGFLGATNPVVWGKYIAAFSKKLSSLGQINGQDVVVSYKWAEGDETNYQTIAQKFVTDGVQAIVTSGTQPVLAALPVVPNNIPIFYAYAGGPFPTTATNIKGTLNNQNDIALANQRLDLLKRMGFPQGTTLLVLGNLQLANAKPDRDNMNTANGAANWFTLKEIDIKNNPTQIETHIMTNIAGLTNVVLYVCTDPMITANQDVIITTAINNKLPTMFGFREYVENGGLMAHGPGDFTDMFDATAGNVFSYLSGTPLSQISSGMPRHKTVVNLVTAAAINVTIPTSVLSQSDHWPP